MFLRLLFYGTLFFSFFIASATNLQAGCDQITSWAFDDSHFFGNDAQVYMMNLPSSVRLSQMNDEYPVTSLQVCSLGIHGDSCLKIYSYESEAQAKEAYDKAVEYWREKTSWWKDHPYAPVEPNIVQEEGNSLLAAVYYRDSFNWDDPQVIHNIYFYSLYRGCIIHWVWAVMGEEVDPSLMPSISSRLFERLAQARSLIDSKCGPIEPTIGLLPQPTDGLAFQTSILQNKVFTIMGHHPNGWTDIKWESLAVVVNGGDVTAHFWNILKNLKIVPEEISDKTILFHITVDPEKFMTEHNLFNIRKNGDTTIQLQICDKNANCTVSPNRIYFGPFPVILGSVEDPKCDVSSLAQSVEVLSLAIGNTGFPSTNNNFYFGLLNPEGLDSYVFVLEECGFLCQRVIERAFHDVKLPTGYWLEISKLAFPINHDCSAHPPAGRYNFLVMIEDKDDDIATNDSKPVDMCGDIQ